MAGATRNDVAVQGGVSNFASIPDLNLNPPGERQYASSNPMPLYVPCTVPAGPPSVQVDTNWVKSHNVMNIVHSPEQSSTPLPEFLKQPPREPEPPVNRWQDPWGDYVPSPIPEEVQALINAYVSGRPFNLFVARSRLYDYWNLALPEEFGFVMMGFFRVLFVQVRLFFLLVFKNDL